MNRIGVVTVTYNSRHVIDGFLTSLLRQTYESFTLYVVDNASSDSTLERIREYSDERIRVIVNSINVGAAEGNNQGIRAAMADYCAAVLLINNDTEFEVSILSELVKGLSEHECEMVAPKILFYSQPNVIWSAGGSFYPARGYASYLYGHGRLDTGEYDLPRTVENAPTTCMLVREDVFGKIGLLDSHYFAYVEDTDFCYRAKSAGLRMTYLPNVKILHKEHSLTGGLLSDFMMRYTTRNRVYFMLKHCRGWQCLYFLPAYQTYLIMQLFLRRIKPSMFWVREKAFMEGLRLWRTSLTEQS